MVDDTKKTTHTRFQYAVGATLATFAYLALAKAPDAAAGFAFLSVVAGGFGLSKATEHLTLK